MTAAVLISDVGPLAEKGHAAMTQDQLGLLESEATILRQQLELLKGEASAEAAAADRKAEDLEAATLLARREREAARKAHRETARALEADNVRKISRLESLFQSTLESIRKMENEGAEQTARAVSLGGPWEAWESHQQRGDKAQDGDQWLEESVRQLTQRLQAAQQTGASFASQLRAKREAIEAFQKAEDDDRARQDKTNIAEHKTADGQLHEMRTPIPKPVLTRSSVTPPASVGTLFVAPATVPSTTTIPSTTKGLCLSTASAEGVEGGPVARPKATSISILAPEMVQTEASCGSAKQSMIATSSAIAVPVPVSPMNNTAEMQNRTFSMPRTAPALRRVPAAEIATASTPASSLPHPVLQRSLTLGGESNANIDVATLPPSPISSMKPALRFVQLQSQRAWSVGNQVGAPTPPPPQQKRGEQLQCSTATRQASPRSRSGPHRYQLVHKSAGQPGSSVSTSPAGAVNTSFIGSSIQVEAPEGPQATAGRLTLRSDVEHHTELSSISYPSSDVWSVDQSLRFGPVLEQSVRVPQVRVIDSDLVSSVTDAVEALNHGKINCPEDACVVFSASNLAYFLLWRKGQEDTAYNWLAMVEARSSPSLVSQHLLSQKGSLVAPVLTTSSWSQDGPRRMARVVKSTPAGTSAGSSTLAVSPQRTIFESSTTPPAGAIHMRRHSPAGTTSTGASLTTTAADSTQSDAARTSSIREYPLISRVTGWFGTSGSTGSHTRSLHMP